MPNWCHDALTVTGEPEVIAAFAEKVRVVNEDGTVTPLTFNHHVPIDDMQSGRSGWGTKWDANFDLPLVALGQEGVDVEKSVGWDGVVQLDERTLVYRFTTAWTPPMEWLEAASNQEKDLEFSLTFAEVGGDFAGRVKVVQGLVVEEEDLKVTDVLEPEEMWF